MGKTYRQDIKEQFARYFNSHILIDKTVLLFKALISDFLVLQVILQSGRAFQILFYTKAGQWPRQRCYWAICWGFLKIIKVYLICEKLRQKASFYVKVFLSEKVCF